MDKKEFMEKWGHMFKLVYDENLFKGDSPEDLPILMLRDALRVIEKEADR